MRCHSLTAIATIAMIAAAPAAPARAGGDAPAAGKRWGADYFPNVPLTTQDGTTVRFYDDLLAGKVVAVELIYTRCKYGCPLETARLAQVQRLLGDRVGRDVHFYSITLDPARDTPEVLKSYAEKFGAGPGWLFLTGRKEDVLLVGRKLGLLSWDEAPVNRDGHTPELMIGDVAAGVWMRNSALDDPRLLARTLERFLREARKDGPAGTYAQARELSMSRGQYLFATRCAACHTIGRGDGIGPDLLGVTEVRDRAWLSRFIRFPDRVLAEGDPIARELHERYRRVTMPNLGLGPEDVAALVEYLAAQRGATGTAAAPSSASASPRRRRRRPPAARGPRGDPVTR